MKYAIRAYDKEDKAINLSYDDLRKISEYLTTEEGVTSSVGYRRPDEFKVKPPMIVTMGELTEMQLLIVSDKFSKRSPKHKEEYLLELIPEKK